MGVRVLGIDPGLTRCGVGIVDAAANRSAELVHVSVLRTPAEMPLEQRLLSIGRGIEALLDEYQPAYVALERVFAQNNVSTVMGTAQISGVALMLAAQRGLTVTLHTPSEVKAAITGYGSADKQQVGTMVTRILGLAEIPKPADAADALALAICHAWRTGVAGAGSAVGGASGGAVDSTGALTPAQKAWRAAERAAGVSGVPRSLKR